MERELPVLVKTRTFGLPSLQTGGARRQQVSLTHKSFKHLSLNGQTRYHDHMSDEISTSTSIRPDQIRADSIRSGQETTSSPSWGCGTSKIILMTPSV